MYHRVESILKKIEICKICSLWLDVWWFVDFLSQFYSSKLISPIFAKAYLIGIQNKEKFFFSHNEKFIFQIS